MRTIIKLKKEYPTSKLRKTLTITMTLLGAALLPASAASPATTVKVLPRAADNKPAPVPAHSGTNLIENGAFESGDTVPEGWFIEAGAGALNIPAQEDYRIIWVTADTAKAKP